MKINLGSGPIATPGWVCIDRSPNLLLSRVPPVKKVLGRLGILAEAHMAQWDVDVVRADIRALPYADSTVEAIYSSHVLEHVYIAEAEQVLHEAFRVLQPGGVIRLALPNALDHARNLIAAEEAGTHAGGKAYNDSLLAHPAVRPTAVGVLKRAIGGHIHRWQPTPGYVTELLKGVGFQDVQRRGYHDGALPDLQLIETRPNSFFLEATK